MSEPLRLRRHAHDRTLPSERRHSLPKYSAHALLFQRVGKSSAPGRARPVHAACEASQAAHLLLRHHNNVQCYCEWRTLATPILAGLILSFDGTAWKKETSGSTETMFDVYAADATHIWVGECLQTAGFMSRRQPLFAR